MADNTANLVAMFIAKGAEDVLRAQKAVSDAGLVTEKILNRLITLEQRKASIEKLAASSTLEIERQKTAAIRASSREADRLHQKEAAQTRERIRLVREEASERNRSAALLRRAGSGGPIGAIGMLGVGGAAVYAGAAVAKDVVQQAARWEQMDVALKATEGSARGASLALNDLYEIAKAPAIDLATAEHAYIKLRATGMEAERAKKTITEFANAVAMGGGGSEQFSRALEQLVQMTTNGRVLQTDLKWMKESMPVLAQLMEEAFGEQSAEGIRKLKIGSDEFLDGILQAMSKLERVGQTTQSSIENLETAWSKFKAGFVSTDFVKGQLDMWTAMLEEMTKQMGDSTVKWGQLLKDSFHNGIPSLIGKFAAGEYTTTPEDAAREDITSKTSRLVELRNLKAQKGLLMGGKNAIELYNLEQWRSKYMADRTGPVSEGAVMDLGSSEIKAKDPRESSKDAERAAKKLASQMEALAPKIRKAYVDAANAGAAVIDKAASNATAKYGFQGITGIGATVGAASMSMGSQMGGSYDKEQVQKIVEDRNAMVDSAQDDWFKSDLDRTKEHYEELRQAILQSTLLTVQEREKMLSEANRREQTERLTTTLSAEAQLAGGISSAVGSAADYVKQGIDYRYEMERRSIERTMSLSGLEGKARVEQQKKRDEALARLDEKRQNDMAGTYQTMFLISKGFALAESVLMLNAAIAKAAAGSMFPQNLIDMAAVASATGSVISNISAINYAGAFHDGGDIPAGSVGMVGDGGPELISGPAHVTSVADTAKLMAPTINIQNYSGQGVSVSSAPDGRTIEIVVGEVAKRVESQLATGIASGQGALGRTIKETYGLTRKVG